MFILYYAVVDYVFFFLALKLSTLLSVHASLPHLKLRDQNQFLMCLHKLEVAFLGLYMI